MIDVSRSAGIMKTTWRLQLLIFTLLEAVPSFSSTYFLPPKQGYSGLGAVQNNSHSTPQFFSTQLQTPLLSGKPATSFLVGKRHEHVVKPWGEDATLQLLLVTVVRRELRHCDLVLACSVAFCWSTVLQTLLMLPNIKQVRDSLDKCFHQSFMFIS